MGEENKNTLKSRVTIERCGSRVELATNESISTASLVVRTANAMLIGRPTAYDWLGVANLASGDSERPSLPQVLQHVDALWDCSEDLENAVSIRIDVSKLFEFDGELNDQAEQALLNLARIADKVSWCELTNADLLFDRSIVKSTAAMFALSGVKKPPIVPVPISTLSREITEQYLDGGTVYSISQQRKMPITHVRRHIDEAFRQRNPGKYAELQSIDGGSKPCLRLLAANRADFGFKET